MNTSNTARRARGLCGLAALFLLAATAFGQATDASSAIGDSSHAAAFDRMKSKVRRHEATAQAHAELVSDDVNAKFAAMEKQEEIDRLLNELKSKRNA